MPVNHQAGHEASCTLRRMRASYWPWTNVLLLTIEAELNVPFMPLQCGMHVLA